MNPRELVDQIGQYTENFTLNVRSDVRKSTVFLQMIREAVKNRENITLNDVCLEVVTKF